jgi:hypothetical protein
MMAETRNCIGLGARLHRLALALPALDETTFLFVKVDQGGHLHPPAFLARLFGGIAPNCGGGKDRLRLLSGLLDSDGAETSDRNQTLCRRPPATIGAVPSYQRLDSGCLDGKCEAG